MAESPLGRALDFLRDFGFFDVVLPFLLIFAIIFGILEKTKIFGTEGDKGLAKKNINAMIAFVLALFFISSRKLVELTALSLPMVGVIAVVVVSVMMLAGFFFSSKEEFTFEKLPWLKYLLIAFVVMGIFITFLHFAGWLNVVLEFFKTSVWSNTVLGSIVLVGFIIAALYLIVHKKGDQTGK